MKRYNVLFVDDDQNILELLAQIFRHDYTVFTATCGAEALSILECENIALIIADQRMPGMTGTAFLERSIHIKPQAIRILLTGYPDADTYYQAVTSGRIYRYITKPWDTEDLMITVQKALEAYTLQQENQRLQEALKESVESATPISAKPKTAEKAPAMTIIGDSRAMQGVLCQVKKVLDNAVTVLLTGETGTGKSTIAHYIHRHGNRRDKPFIVQNCGALPEQLLESELFGHKKGAFSGAVTDHKGIFETVDGGTLFLDEVSEMSPAMQVKLLQILQERRFRRVGDTSYREVDVRIIAATNKDLLAEVDRGNFRKDLYYRLHVFAVEVPPLRERIEDIPLLARHCLRKYASKLNKTCDISHEALNHLCGHYYPGNVRELENMLERGMILCDGDRLEPADLIFPSSVKDAEIGYPTIKQLQREYILGTLRLCNGKLGQAAQDLGISRTTLWRRMQEYNGVKMAAA